MVSPRAQRTLRSSNPAGLPGLPALVGDENLSVVWPVDGDDCRLTLLCTGGAGAWRVQDTGLYSCRELASPSTL